MTSGNDRLPTTSAVVFSKIGAGTLTLTNTGAINFTSCMATVTNF